jgi:cell division protein FtsB
VSDEQPFDHNGECRYCDELGMHRADCAWLLEMVADHARLQKAAAMLAVGTDDLAVAFDEQQTEIEQLRAQLDAAKDEIEKLQDALAGR